MGLPLGLVEYDRRNDRLSSLPDQIVIEPVMGCNLRCPMCPVTGLPSAMDGRTPTVMSLEVYQRILGQISDRPRYILLTIFGEPLLHPRIVEFVTLAKDAGHSVNLITNGTKLTPELAGRLIDSRLDVLTVSIDGHSQETYEGLRVGASRDAVLGNLRHLAAEIARRAGGLRVEINYLVSPRTAHERDAFYREFSPLVQRINFNPVTDFGAQFELPDDLVPAGGDPRLISRLHATDGFTRNACVYLWKEMFISAEGRVMLCCNDFKHTSGLPNVMERPLLDIWQNAVGAYRADHVQGHFDNGPCGSCRLNVVPFRVPAAERQSILTRARRQALLRTLVPAAILPPAARRRRWQEEMPFGCVDVPAPDSTVAGPIPVQGWAVGAAGRTIERIEIRVDGELKGRADGGAFRPDVGEAHPGEGHSFSGFSYALDTSSLTNGAHVLDVTVTDNAARRVDLGARAIFVRN
jgi:MoaA/NifB/PqqE/SkfB family radical SAM enzyme